jgi:hypothetical protein
MKKSIPGLKLRQETIRVLGIREITAARGGILGTESSCSVSVPTRDPDTCSSCEDPEQKGCGLSI